MSSPEGSIFGNTLDTRFYSSSFLCEQDRSEHPHGNVFSQDTSGTVSQFQPSDLYQTNAPEFNWFHTTDTRLHYPNNCPTIGTQNSFFNNPTSNMMPTDSRQFNYQYPWQSWSPSQEQYFSQCDIYQPVSEPDSTPSLPPLLSTGPSEPQISTNSFFPQISDRELVTRPRLRVRSERANRAIDERRKAELKFFCPLEGCGVGLTKKKNLAYHLDFHEGRRPHQCFEQGCQSAFVTPADLKRHLKGVHRMAIKPKCA